RNILSSLSSDFSLPIVLCLHRLRDFRSGLCESLRQVSTLDILEPEDKSPVFGQMVYLAPANYHLLFEDTNHFVLSVDEEVNFSRPAIDLTFDSAARVFGKKVLVILLSGANSDGVKGISNCKDNGGYTMVQDPDDAAVATMPKNAIKYFSPDKIATEKEIIQFLNKINKGNIKPKAKLEKSKPSVRFIK
ncbi:MAG: chemotaxis protein CheB, partial [Bacteroidales bacterium]|nr:chemotaxis protein CheB [Bacteroidales bacterium]